MTDHTPTRNELTARIAALEQEQTGVAEVLRIISRSPTQLNEVLKAVLDSAVRLSGALWGSIVQVEGERVRTVAVSDDRPWPETGAWHAQRRSLVGTAIAERRIVHVLANEDELRAAFPDAPEPPPDFRPRIPLGERYGRLAVPLLRGDTVVGAFLLRRAERVFSDAEVALVQTFADQAVIAIENARLFQELQDRNREVTEALERQTATGEVLEIISRSPTDLQAVLDAIVQRAARLVGARAAIIHRLVGERLEPVSAFPAGARGAGRLDQPGRANDLANRARLTTIAVLEGRTIHRFGGADAIAAELPDTAATWRTVGTGSAVALPLLSGGDTFGTLFVGRGSPEPFTPAQIELLEAFAAQAAIAIENSRLFSELQESNATLREALEQQTATAEVVRIISRAPTELQRVLDVVLDSAGGLCGAHSGFLTRFDGVTIWNSATFNSRLGVVTEDQRTSERVLAPEGWVTDRAIAERRIIRFVGDREATRAAFPRTGWPREYEGIQARLAVPMLREGEPVGGLMLTRHGDVPFSDNEAALVQMFADQAVIAIENARLFQEIEENSRELERASRAKSDFLSRMSHELRTPLNAILGFAEIMEMDSATSAQQLEWIGHQLKAGRHLLGLINEVLDIARIEEGRLSLSPEPVAVGEAVHTAAELVRPLAAERNVHLELALPAADETWVRADRQRLGQVLLNLLSNAVKYNREDGSVSVTCEERPDDRVRLTVRDTGPGIPADQLDRLFLPFERLGAAESGVEGAGLGLAIVKRLVEAMDGAAGAESTVGEGSAFWVELPRADAPVLDVSADLAWLAPAVIGAGGRAATVLYIEDNLPNLTLVEQALRFRPAITLLSAMQGTLGIDLARQHRPDLILLDLNLPDLQGDEVLARLQADLVTHEIPVVIVSADATPGQVERLLAAGASDYLTKPLEVRRLLDLLDATLAREGPSR